MAEIKTDKKVEKIEREDIFIPKGYGNDDPNLFVSINGKNYILPKGKTSNVPTYVAEEIRRGWKAQEKRDAKSDQMLENGKEPMYKL